MPEDAFKLNLITVLFRCAFMAEIKAVWKGRRRFEASSSSGVARMDGEGEGGMSPMELVLAALAGCSGYDLTEIMEKMKEKVEALEIEVRGTRREEQPKVFTRIDIRYILSGGINREKARRAIDLSLEKYCSVAAMLRSTAEIHYEVEIKG